MGMEVFALILFVAILLFILSGYPVAFTLGGLSIIIGVIAFGPEMFSLLPMRIFGVMENYVLLAVPLFVFMGVMLEKSGLAENLLESMAGLFGNVRGGLAISVVLVGALLAASTGIVGATVVTMGMISLPTMLKRGYKVELATGTIASAGTLGQIIPPSVVLVLLGSVLNVSVGDLFTAAILPGVMLVACYIVYILVISYFKPDFAPLSRSKSEFKNTEAAFKKFALAFIFPLLLILAVLGSILAGIASPTEAAAVGAFGALLLAIGQKKLNLGVLKQAMKETTHLTSMVFLILLGATTFTLVFRTLGGDDLLIQLIEDAQLSKYAFLILVMCVVFILGFFIDFIEIVFIVVPVVAPIFVAFEMDLIWIGILLALNLQTSFLSPPFGFSLFYLKGVAPPSVSTQQIYRGIVPFVLIQLVFLALVAFFS